MVIIKKVHTDSRPFDGSMNEGFMGSNRCYADFRLVSNRIFIS